MVWLKKRLFANATGFSAFHLKIDAGKQCLSRSLVDFPDEFAFKGFEGRRPFIFLHLDLQNFLHNAACFGNLGKLFSNHQWPMK